MEENKMNRTEYMIQKYEMYIKMWKKDLENASKNLAEDLAKGYASCKMLLRKSKRVHR